MPVDMAFRVSNPAGYFALGILNGDVSTGARYGYLSRYTAGVGFGVTAQAMPASLPAPGGQVTFDVHVTNVGDTAADLTTLADRFTAIWMAAAPVRCRKLSRRRHPMIAGSP